MKNKFRSIVVVLVMLLVASSATYAASKVAISFDKYHGYTGTVDYLKAINKAYPNITDLVEIGRSTQNRPIYVLAITNKKTGTTLDLEKTLVHERKLEVPNPPKQPAELGKAAYLITGCTHGNEVTGNEVCLYFIDQMVSGYGSDPAITEFIDTKVAYVIPAINVDGLYNTVQLGAAQRTNSMNQEGTPFRQDVNKDKKYSQVRYKDPNGVYKIDPTNPLRMVRIGRNEEVPADQRYSVTTEALPDAGIDLNRNFPEAWWNTKTLMPAGSGAYATSAIETQVICEFIVSHPNIFMVNEYHTQGGFTYRPLGSAPDRNLKARDIVVYDQILGKKYQDLFGAEKLGDVWKSCYNAERPYAGLLMDWLYVQNGIYSMGTELWNPQQEVPSLKGLSGQEYQNALINYANEQGMYLNWTKANHPVHGECEVGGWVTGGNNNAYPGEHLLTICKRQWEFDSYCMSLMPQMAIENVVVETVSKVGNTKVLNITADIVNVGELPTSPYGTEGVALCRGDVAWIMGSNNVTVVSNNACEKLGNLYGVKEIPGFSGSNVSTVTWTVAVEGNAPLKIVASSLKGGTVVHNIKY